MDEQLIRDRNASGQNLSSTSSSDSGSGLLWRPSAGTAFSAYAVPHTTSSGLFLRSSSLRVVERRPLVSRLTKEIVETYQRCNREFKHSESLNPKRYLTNPSAGVLNDCHDNANSDLILHVNLLLADNRYVVKDVLGQGTFGQVAKCWDTVTNSFVAVKVIKNQPAYYQQALVEVSMLQMLNKKFDPDDQNHIVRILDYFVHQQHLCIAFEMLGSNLYELIKMNRYKGLSLSYVQSFSKQILHALIVMKDAGIIHCDLKPENILISPRAKPPEIKVIDFGSACMEGRTIYSYIQSRYYRSPEVLLGYPYTTAIDMWSFGCIVAELFLGLPLFPGASEYDLLKRMIEILGGQPPDSVLRDAKNTSKFFKHVGSIYPDNESSFNGVSASAYRVLTEEEFEARESKKPTIGKRYFMYIKLEDIIAHYPYRNNLAEEEILKERLSRRALIDFLRGLVEFDPGKRWSPVQAFYHPFVTGEPFTSPYRPSPETPRIPVFHAVMVDHNPGGGHWLAAGLSPQVGNGGSRCMPYNSPHFPKMPLSYGSSYGSVGSHGSYNESAGLGTSYGSYSDMANTMNAYYSPFGGNPAAFNLRTQVGGTFLGSSPDVRCRPHHAQVGGGGGGFGLSPSNLGPMSLGASPSQFTPPNNMHHLSGAAPSPGKYAGPTSPMRGGGAHFHHQHQHQHQHHGSSSLGKVAAAGQFSRRRNWGVPLPASMPPPHHHGQGHLGDIASTSHQHQDRGGHAAAYSYSLLSNSPSQNNNNNNNSNSNSWRQQQSSTSRQVAVPLSPSSDISSDRFESCSSIPDPADWDPNYSEESLLQEDNADVRSLSLAFNDGVNLDGTSNGSVHVHTSTTGPGQGPGNTSSNYYSLNQRADRSFQASSHGEGRNLASNSAYGATTAGFAASQNYLQQMYPPTSHYSAHQHSAPRLLRSNTNNNSNSNTMVHGQRNRQNGHLTWSTFTIDESHPPSNSMLGDSIPWGGRVGHPFATNLPSSLARNEYGQIL